MSVPKIKMLTYFLKKCDAEGFSPKRQNTSGKNEKVKDIEIVTSLESPFLF